MASYDMSIGGAIGGGLGSIWGAFSTYSAIDAQNKAIEAEARRNIEIYEAQKVVTEFAQTNNSMRAQQIQAQIEQEAAAKLRETGVAATEAVSKETIRRGEGITAGRSVQRSVDNIIKKGQEAKLGVINQAEQQKYDIYSQASQANAKEQIGLIQSYSNMVNKNTQLANQVVSGAQAFMAVSQGALSGFQSGFKTGSSIGNVMTPDAPQIGTGYQQTQLTSLDNQVQQTSDLFGGNITYNNGNNPFNNLIF